ncbi:hypothetical protein AN958_04012 [Leucoagaricus sp. SymC.cos]|nr:hypothetical protein AN958_04012 [Leucoagaricus sp. SymC.cos]
MLADFGVSIIVSTNVGTTAAEDFSGIIYWMAPELLVAEVAQPSIPQSDMWGFCRICFEVTYNCGDGSIWLTYHDTGIDWGKSIHRTCDYRPQQLLAVFTRGQATPVQPKSNSETTIVNGPWWRRQRCWNYDSSQRSTAAEALQYFIKLNVTDERPSMDEELALFEAAKGGKEEAKIDYGHILSLVHKAGLNYSRVGI